MFTKLDKYFTDKKRGIFALGAIGFAILWMILWYIFAMPFYSLFFGSTIGSNIQIVLLNLTVLFPFFWLFTKLSGTDLSFSKAVLMNVLLAAGVEYVFSIFMFSDHFYICVIAYIVHALVRPAHTGRRQRNQRRNLLPQRLFRTPPPLPEAGPIPAACSGRQKSPG